MPDLAISSLPSLTSPVVGDYYPVSNSGITRRESRTQLATNLFALKSTTDLGEGDNLYFTEARVLGTDLAGFASSAGPITDTDTILQAFGKTQGNIDAITTSITGFDPHKLLISNSAGEISDDDFNNVVFLQRYDTGGNFGSSLQNAIDTVSAGTVIDCSFYSGALAISATINVSKAVKIILPKAIITATLSANAHVFNFQSDIIWVEGTGRSTREDELGDTTRIVISGSGKGYHFFSKGNNVLKIKGMDLIGTQSTPYTTNGSGGITLWEGDPFISGGGNNVNQVNIEDVLISGSRDHAIFSIGAILWTVKNVRASSTGGHGFYFTGSNTTTYLENCYASSGTLAGFCLDGSSTTVLNNCAAEYFGIGYFIRGAFNCTLLGCDAEENQTRDTGSMPNNLGITVVNSGGTVTVNDIGSDNVPFFKGTSFMISGGRNISVFNPFSRDPGQAAFGTSVNSYHYLVLGSARAMYIVNPRCSIDGSSTAALRFDVAIRTLSVDSPRDINFFFNPSADGTVTPSVSGTYITGTNSSGTATVVLDQGLNTDIHNGSTFYTDYTFDKLKGTGTRLVTSDSTGKLGNSSIAIPVSGWVVKSGDTMTGNLLFSSGFGIDAVATGGTDTLNIGATNTDVINIGRSGATVNILGTAVYEYATNAYVVDKLITLNSGGAVSSAVATGFEIEENAIITGYVKTSTDRNGYDFKAPNQTYGYSVKNTGATAARTYLVPDHDGTFATQAGAETLTNKLLDTGVYYQGNTIQFQYGGTSFNTYSPGDLLYGDYLIGLNKLSIGAEGYILSVVPGPSSTLLPGWVSMVTMLAPYIKKDGSVPLEDDWNAGPFTATFGNASIGNSSFPLQVTLATGEGDAGLFISTEDTIGIQIDNSDAIAININAGTGTGLNYLGDGIGVNISTTDIGIVVTSTTTAAMFSQIDELDTDNTDIGFSIIRNFVLSTFDATGDLLRVEDNCGASGYLFNALQGGVSKVAITGPGTLLLGAGTTTRAPMRFTSGSAAVSSDIIAGNIEYNGNWYVTKAGDIQMGLPGSIGESYTSTGTVGTTPTDIFSFSVKTSMLAVDGDEVVARYGMTLATAATLKAFNLYFGGTQFLAGTAFSIANSTGSASVFVSLERSSSSTVRYVITIFSSEGVANDVKTGEITGLTLSAANTLRFSAACGVGSNNNDVVGYVAKYNFNPKSI